MVYAKVTHPPAGLRLHLNENTAGCSPAVLEALRAISREEVSVYPDYRALTTAAEQWFNVPQSWVQLTNGLDEGLHVAAQWAAVQARSAAQTSTEAASGYLSDQSHPQTDRGTRSAAQTGIEAASDCLSDQPHAQTDRGPDPAYARRGRAPSAVLIVEPAFEMYAACAEAVGLGATHIPPEDDFRFPLDAILSAISAETRLIYLTDPNNPTGLAIPPGAVERIADAAPRALILVDEAYAEFSGRTFIGLALERHRNLLVGRTFAKAHGLAALRIGALVAHPETLAPLGRMLPPYSLNIAAVRALGAALGDPQYLEAYVAQSVESRRLLYDFCDRHHLEHWPSDANFVLIRIGPDASRVVAALSDRGVLIRDRSASPGCAGCVRITAGNVGHTRICVSALEDVLASRAR